MIIDLIFREKFFCSFLIDFQEVFEGDSRGILPYEKISDSIFVSF